MQQMIEEEEEEEEDVGGPEEERVYNRRLLEGRPVVGEGYEGGPEEEGELEGGGPEGSGQVVLPQDDTRRLRTRSRLDYSMFF